jgi:ribokinase
MSCVLVLGNATIDVIQRVARLPVAGETLLGEPPLRCPGGKGFNQALVAARTGAAIRFAAPVGDDMHGAMLRAAIAGEGLLHVEWIEVEAATDLSTVWVDAQGRNMIVSSAACASALTPAQAATQAGSLRSGDWLLMQGNLSHAATCAAASGARGQGARVALNAAPIAFDFADLLPLCDLLIVNEVEASTLGGGEAPYAAARRLAASRDVVLTLGAAGAVMVARDGEIAVAAPRVAAVDTAGAGDVLVGTLLGLASQGTPFAQALRVAVMAASLSTTRPGTSRAFPSAEEIADLRALPARSAPRA